MLFMLRAKNSADLEGAIASNYPNDHIQVHPGTWLISTEEGQTARAVWERLVGQDTKPTGIVVSFVGYYGRESSDIWEWIAAKRNAQK